MFCFLSSGLSSTTLWRLCPCSILPRSSSHWMPCPTCGSLDPALCHRDQGLSCLRSDAEHLPYAGPQPKVPLRSLHTGAAPIPSVRAGAHRTTSLFVLLPSPSSVSLFCQCHLLLGFCMLLFFSWCDPGCAVS